RIGTAAVLARLLYRAGLWNDAAQLVLRHLDRVSDDELDELVGADEKKKKNRKKKADSRRSDLLSLIRRWATIVGKGGGPEQALVRISMIASSVQDPMVRAELCSYAVIASSKYIDDWQFHRKLLKSVIRDSAHGIEPNQWIRERQVLRLAILTGGG